MEGRKNETEGAREGEKGRGGRKGKS